MYRFVQLQEDGKFIKYVSDEDFDGAIKILVPLNYTRALNEYPTKCWLDENKTLQITGNLPKDNYDEIIEDINNLKAKLQGVDLSQLTKDVNDLNEAYKTNDSEAINAKIQSIGSIAMNAQSQLEALQNTNK